MDPMLTIAFACFALLFAGWIFAPNGSSAQPDLTATSPAVLTDPAPSPA